MSAFRLLLVSTACVLLGSACALLGVKEQREAFQRFARIRGEVKVEPPSETPIVVVLMRASDDPNAIDPETGEPADSIVDHYRLERAGSFGFAVTPGSFRLMAFADENSNLVYDPGEPALAPQPLFAVGAGETRDQIQLVIPHDATLDQTFDIRTLKARTPKDQENFSLGRFTVRGSVVDLDDPKFGASSGQMGLWRFVDFLFEVGPGVYFLEPYDPAKIPVLFVHGISGYPQEFSTLIGNLDRKHFQPWFYFYPSGFHLDAISNHLTQTIIQLQRKEGFDQMAVVAHSMGGLVSRSFILDYFEQTGRRDIALFVAISTPWGGDERAARAANAPERMTIFSWLDMNPSSDFLRSLFYQPPDYLRARPLPDHTEFHMMFGYQRRERSRGPSSDGVVTVKSEARIEAIDAARSVVPLDYNHVDILHSDETAGRLNAILDDVFEESVWQRGAH